MPKGTLAMRLLQRLLAAIGLFTLIAIAVALVALKFGPLSGFDRHAGAVYWRVARRIVETGNSAEATVWKAKVKTGLTFDEVDQSIKSLANEMNIKGVGELPLSDQVEAMSGKKWRKLKIYLFCNPLTAARMIDYSDAYAAYLPCRISLLEDKTGALWIYSLDMDMMIFGGKPLPPELKREALQVKKILLSVLERGAKGEF